MLDFVFNMYSPALRIFGAFSFTHLCSSTFYLQEMYKMIAWPLYRIYGHAFEAMKTMVADDGAGIFKRLEEENGGPIDLLTPEVGLSQVDVTRRSITVGAYATLPIPAPPAGQGCSFEEHQAPHDPTASQDPC